MRSLPRLRRGVSRGELPCNEIGWWTPWTPVSYIRSKIHVYTYYTRMLLRRDCAKFGLLCVLDDSPFCKTAYNCVSSELVAWLDFQYHSDCLMHPHREMERRDQRAKNWNARGVKYAPAMSSSAHREKEIDQTNVRLKTFGVKAIWIWLWEINSIVKSY